MTKPMNDVAQLEGQLANTKDLLERRTLALKLSTNREFKKLILEDFIVTEAARLVALSADPALDAQQRADALSMAQAAGHLKRFLSMTIQMGAVAERDLSDVEEALAEARAESDSDEHAGATGQDEE